MRIEKCLVLNSDHMSGNDEGLISHDNVGLPVVQTDTGYLITARAKPGNYKGLSRSFKKLVALAKRQDCEWIRFDHDAEYTDGFRIHT